MAATSPPLDGTLPLRARRPSLRRRHLERAIRLTVAYADIFDHAVTAREIHRYLVGRRASRIAVLAALAGGRLVPSRLARAGRFYTLPGRQALAAVRSRREAAAARLWPQAERYARLFACLPFVRMVAVTGSLAVNNTEPDSDIDFLLVTRPGRLWLTRLLVAGILRIASRRGSRICPNYMLTERALEMRERTLYTARELAQMVPLAGAGLYRRMRLANAWADALLPNAAGPPPRARPPARRSRWQARARRALRRFGEGRLRGRLGDWLERRERAIKIPMSYSWPDHFGEARFTPDEVKGHSTGHGARTLAAYARRLARLGERAHA